MTTTLPFYIAAPSHRFTSSQLIPSAADSVKRISRTPMMVLASYDISASSTPFRLSSRMTERLRPVAVSLSTIISGSRLKASKSASLLCLSGLQLFAGRGSPVFFAWMPMMCSPSFVPFCSVRWMMSKMPWMVRSLFSP